MAKLQLRSAREKLNRGTGSIAGSLLAVKAFVIASPSRSRWLSSEHHWVAWSRWRIDSAPGLYAMTALNDVSFKMRHEVALALATALDLDGYEVASS